LNKSGLMGEKEAAAQSLEGKFDCQALRTMMNGGASDDIVAALASSLEHKVSAQDAWKKMDKPPVVKPMPVVELKTVVKYVQGLLFDLEPVAFDSCGVPRRRAYA